MFHEARIKLTLYYLIIILLISGIFSAAFYNVSTREINRIISRLEIERQIENTLFRSLPIARNAPSIEELLEYKKRMRETLVLVNGLILVISGAGGFFLAGKTLRPIKQMVDEQNQFISDASHELRTPIATLQAEMEGKLLEKRIPDRQARLLIKSNLEELGSLKRLVNSLLQVNKTRYLEGNQKFEKISLLEVVNSARSKVASLAKEKQITIKIEMPEIVINANKDTLTEAFVILFENALKYSPNKTKIELLGKKHLDSVEVSVSDKGVGIAKEDLPHIFERFYRADKSRSQTEGFGLGLSIAKKIIDFHKGTITAESIINKGSVFTVLLPFSQS
jgi:signal transduction histidine kinase